MQRQKRQSWDLWKRSYSPVTDGMAFYPERPEIDGIPDLQRLVIVCDGERSRVAAVMLTLPRGMEDEIADAFVHRFATVSRRFDQESGRASWRDGTDHVTIEYGPDRPGSFDLVFMTHSFQQALERYTQGGAVRPAWWKAPD